IGAVLTPALTGGRGLVDLPFASSLCGACRDVCPVRIDIPGMLVALRARAGQTAEARWERRAARVATWLLCRPRLYRWASVAARVLEPVVRRVPVGALRHWARGRDLPRLSPTPFHRAARR
ncbi:MAG: (4Fe-4S)-binding protein, partial [Armatimonadota bacterium]|nr:(4Fe-4S)-binding protein [Armatimonadota bacterium]